MGLSLKLVFPFLFMVNSRQPTKIRYERLNGLKVRVSKRSDRVIPKPSFQRSDWKTREDYIGLLKWVIFFHLLTCCVPEGSKDTNANAATKVTYTPSLVSFEKDILAALNLALHPHAPKTRA
jgi:hypothetical protein